MIKETMQSKLKQMKSAMQRSASCAIRLNLINRQTPWKQRIIWLCRTYAQTTDEVTSNLSTALAYTAIQTQVEDFDRVEEQDETQS